MMCLVLGAGCASTAGSLRAIGELEDRRDLSDGRLEALARQDDPDLRLRALRALGRVQDPATATTLVQALHRRDPASRAEAAFSLGLLALANPPWSDQVRDEVSRGLVELDGLETESTVREPVLDALGRVATAAALDRLAGHLGGPLSARAALALGYAVKVRSATLPQPTLSGLRDLLRSPTAEVREAAGWALGQAKWADAQQALTAATQDDAADVRAVAARALADLPATPESVAALERLLSDAEVRPAVEATRALAKLASPCEGPCLPAVALGVLEVRARRFEKGGVSHPLLALAQAGVPAAVRPVLDNIRAALQAVAATRKDSIGQSAANLDCRFAAEQDRLDGRLSASLQCGAGQVDAVRQRVYGLHALAGARANQVSLAEVARGELANGDARLRLAAVELLEALKQPSANEALRALVSDQDAVLAAAAAHALGSFGDLDSKALVLKRLTALADDAEVLPTFIEAASLLGANEAVPRLRGLLESASPAVRLAAAEALSTLTHSPVQARASVARLAAADDEPRGGSLKVSTNKGVFVISLFTKEAPRTTAHLARLARASFFRGLTFHRVVPGFVVQGGDPRGDGEGGPGYSIRCEINPRRYQRGTVGMALAGKDTGGSQFFVTLAPQPHLDGRYTVVGQVTSGLEVVDELLEGDRMLDVEVLP